MSTEKLVTEAALLYRDMKAKAKVAREAQGTDKGVLLLIALVLAGAVICIAVGLRGFFEQPQRGVLVPRDESESLQLSPTRSSAITRWVGSSVKLRVFLELTEIACEFHAELSPDVLHSAVSS